MLSIIITTYNEPKTLEQTLNIFLNEKINDDYEILVVAPDEESGEVISKKFNQYPQIKFLKDQGKGKPAALNFVFQKAKGEILILTDGDVVIEQGSVNKLLGHFFDSGVGAVCGQPISISPRQTMFGYWSHFLVNAAHQRRLKLAKKNKYFDCSGYLYAIRAGIVKEIPENVLADDVYISQKIWGKIPLPPLEKGDSFNPPLRKGGVGGVGYKIIYEPEAKVKVKYPDNLSDWLKQKKRSASGASQKIDHKKLRMRSFFKEAFDGSKLFFTFPKNLKEFWWTKLLFWVRIYLWLLIFIDLKIRKKKFQEIWKRVESTK